MTPVVSDDAFGVNFAQVGPPNDEPAFPAALGKSRSSFVAEPGPGRRCRKQELRLTKVMCVNLCHITFSVMQGLVIVEKDPRRRRKSPEGVAQADDGTVADRELDIAQSLQRCGETHARCVVGTQDRAGSCQITNDEAGPGGEECWAPLPGRQTLRHLGSEPSFATLAP
jgi:hypothetical protein